MKLSTMTTQRVKCSKCGAETDWDIELGPNPFCLYCWDEQVEKAFRERVAASQRDYREKNRERVAAYQRDYYEKNRERV